MTEQTARRIHSACPEDTRRAAAELAASLARGAVLALYGPLGAGKTCFVQGLAEALEVRDPVSSPTFTLVNEYEGRLPVYHIDLYRVRNAEEALRIGLDEYLFGDGVAVIEWAERIESLLPPHTLRVRLEVGGPAGERNVCFEESGQ